MLVDVTPEKPACRPNEAHPYGQATTSGEKVAYNSSGRPYSSPYIVFICPQAVPVVVATLSKSPILLEYSMLNLRNVPQVCIGTLGKCNYHERLPARDDSVSSFRTVGIIRYARSEAYNPSCSAVLSASEIYDEHFRMRWKIAGNE